MFLAIVTILGPAFLFKVHTWTLSRNRKKKVVASWHNYKKEPYREKFMHTYKGEAKPSEIEISAPMRLKNFREIFTGEPAVEVCEQCNRKLLSVPVALSISFSGRVLHAEGKYCKACDEKPEPMHVILKVDGCIAMLS